MPSSDSPSNLRKLTLATPPDAKALLPVVDRLRRRFGIARMCVVACRGMISAKTMAELEAWHGVYPRRAETSLVVPFHVFEDAVVIDVCIRSAIPEEKSE
jgi:hypothetical protein